MGLAASDVPALADDAPFMDQHRAHHGIGLGGQEAVPGELDATLHVFFVYHFLRHKDIFSNFAHI